MAPHKKEYSMDTRPLVFAFITIITIGALVGFVSLKLGCIIRLFLDQWFGFELVEVKLGLVVAFELWAVRVLLW